MPAAKKRARTAKKSQAGDAADPQVVVLGNHPAAHVAALELAEADVRVAIVDLGTTPLPDRLVSLNPGFFGLSKSLEAIRSELTTHAIRGIEFIGPDGVIATTTENVAAKLTTPRKDDPLSSIVSLAGLISATRRLAVEAGVTTLTGTIEAEEIRESGVALRIGRQRLTPKLLIVVDPLPVELATAIGAPHAGVHAEQPCMLTTFELAGMAAPRTMAMALDLGDHLAWGWLMGVDGRTQICVQHPSNGDSTGLLREWLGRLQRAGRLDSKITIDGRGVKTRPIYPGGALQRDVVARRTLLAGPAGGFVSSTGEDVYPSCWSAVIAAEVAAKAVKATQVQDALGHYRGKWGGSLGEYLLGPQQNLRFLLPLVFKNPVMTDRLAESIFRGQSLVK